MRSAGGFGWNDGPFEIWQAAGWQTIAQWIADDIAAGKTMAAVSLPAWVTDGRQGAHSSAGSYSPTLQRPVPRSALPVYRRQLFPEQLRGEPVVYGTTVFETDAVRMWSTGDDIAIVSFKSRMHAIGNDVLDGILEAIDRAEAEFGALVIWQTEPPFSVGANLKQTPAGGGRPAPPSAAEQMLKKFRRATEAFVLKAARLLNVADQLMAGRLAEVERLVAQFQHTTAELRYCMVPTIAAVDGMALGGGCEVVMHCDRAVATLESYIGLVEAGVGLLPAGGGCTEFARRAANEARGGDLFPFIRRYFERVATAQVSKSAEHARALGYLRETDRIVMNRFELLYIAKQEARLLAEAGYRPTLKPRAIPVAGRSVIATLEAYMANLLAGQFISEHDYLIGCKIAEVMCGGKVEAGSLVDERWLRDLELQHFMELLATEKTQARIAHTLKTGKPLRN